MPFICLGAFAEPGHPHRFPHFVFVDPVLAMPEMMQMTPTQDSPSHSQHAQHTKVNDAQAAKQPVGRATSSLMLFSILILAGLAAWLLSRIDQPERLKLLSHPFPNSITLAILLPPPRLATSL